MAVWWGRQGGSWELGVGAREGGGVALAVGGLKSEQSVASKRGGGARTWYSEARERRSAGGIPTCSGTDKREWEWEWEWDRDWGRGVGLGVFRRLEKVTEVCTQVVLSLALSEEQVRGVGRSCRLQVQTDS